MSAYLIVDIARITDEATYARYRGEVSAGLALAGGEYLARGGAVEVLEGDWRPHRIVLVRFESAAAARAWWASPAYAHLRDLRQSSTSTNMIVVDGMDRHAQEAS